MAVIFEKIATKTIGMTKIRIGSKTGKGSPCT
jgi:hypothetical protein